MQLRWTNELDATGQPSGALPVYRPIREAAFAAAYESAVTQMQATKAWLASDEDALEPLSTLEDGWACSSSLLQSSPPAPRLDAPNTTSSNPAKNQLADWMDAHALVHSSHHCAMYYREGLEAAGMNTADRPQSGDAGDYGPFLLRHGAQVVPADNYSPQVGDTVVFDKTEQHPNGHIEMYDGRQWVSDFLQHGFSPYRDTGSTPPFTIYRL